MSIEAVASSTTPEVREIPGFVQKGHAVFTGNSDLALDVPAWTPFQLPSSPAPLPGYPTREHMASLGTWKERP